MQYVDAGGGNALQLRHPGSFVGLFVATSTNHSELRGIVTRWQWSPGCGIASNTEHFAADPELQDAYWTALECHAKMTGTMSNLSLELHAEDREFLQDKRFSLTGASLGLSMLLGLICYHAGRPWPPGMFAWGNIRPVRDGRFGLYAVDHIDDKLAVARSAGLRHLVHPEEEGTLLRAARETLVPRNVTLDALDSALKH